MLLEGGRSGLVRLSDSLKTNLLLCERSTFELLGLVRPHLAAYEESQRLAGAALAGRLAADQAESQMRDALSAIPDDVSGRVAYLAAQEIHTLSFSSVLLSCFCLESYINTLGYFLFKEADFLSLIKHGHETSAEVLIDALARMSVRDKWKTVGRVRGGNGFDASQPPFQDFHVLFRFRDDQVHDKVIAWGPDGSKARYNGRFPEATAHRLDLGHALYAATTYWSMVKEVHKLAGVARADFQRHYNLRPWIDDAHRTKMETLAADYRNASQRPS